MKVYRLYDKNSGHFYESRRGRTLFKTPGHAKQSYELDRGLFDKPFDALPDLVVLQYELELSKGKEVAG